MQRSIETSDCAALYHGLNNGAETVRLESVSGFESLPSAAS